MRVKIKIVSTDEFEIDPADYIDPDDFEPGEKPTIEDILEAVKAAIEDDPASFIHEAGVDEVTVENIP